MANGLRRSRVATAGYTKRFADNFSVIPYRAV